MKLCLTNKDNKFVPVQELNLEKNKKLRCVSTQEIGIVGLVIVYWCTKFVAQR